MFKASTEKRFSSPAETGRPPRRRRGRALSGAAVLSAALALPAGALAQTNFRPATNYPAGSAPYAVAQGDWNHDQDLDLAVANYFSDDVKVVLGDLGGNFIPMGIPDAGDGPSSVGVGDFNADNDPDLAVADQTSDKVSV